MFDANIILASNNSALSFSLLTEIKLFTFVITQLCSGADSGQGLPLAVQTVGCISSVEAVDFLF